MLAEEEQNHQSNPQSSAVSTTTSTYQELVTAQLDYDRKKQKQVTQLQQEA